MDIIKKNIERRHKKIDLEKVANNIRRTNLLKKELDELKAEKNILSKQFPVYQKEGKDIAQLKRKIEKLNNKIKEIENNWNKAEQEKRKGLLRIPNILLDDVPEGKDESESKLIREFPPKKKFSFEPLSHYDIGLKNDILDFDGGVDLSGSRFVLLKGKGSILHRALLTFMLNIQNENGFQEIYPPFLVKREILEGTGQIPDKEEDLYKIEGEDLYLIPTAEVPLVNWVKGMKLIEDDLPIRLTGYSSCFRKEAGSYGKDIRGLIRVHQFDKVELVSVTTPEKSEEEFEFLLESAEKILKLLKLPYRVIELCAGDTGFTAAKTYDLEVWLPSQNTYREVSSISNCTDFQARRVNLKFKTNNKEKKLVHTLNGSALAIGRTLVAILENYQNSDGTIDIPKVLQPFTGFKTT
ncbi:serine--tRNA ligase [bacterium]|nr:serine--tRNA ligase [bacterium]